MEIDVVESGAAQELGQALGGLGPAEGWVGCAQAQEEFGRGAGPFGLGLHESRYGHCDWVRG
ncbi:MAG: hypothetical protein M3Z32_08620, partial [Acidobacteriota bacterium]|nr:hypothetical protein [Acidobacteriota bacterium]